jgi:peptide/nickel transport system permease protein
MNLDFPGIMGVTLVITVIFVTINLIIDLLYAFIDPRIVYK